jgi:NifU-like protein involved in Fe-S cluster formation
MENELEEKIKRALSDPQNLGEMDDADAVGTVGSSNCGEMLRMWIKFKEQNGKKVIDRATFQSFGCETAIAVAGLATELIRGKTAEEALSLSGQELAGELGPLPPMKIHCSQLVEEALRAALAPNGSGLPANPGSSQATLPGSSLLEKISAPSSGEGKVQVVFLDQPPTDTNQDRSSGA